MQGTLTFDIYFCELELRFPIQPADIFGDELHRYSIADGIRDKNVLGFDPTMVLVYKDKELREMVALQESKAQTEEQALADPVMSKKYYHFMSSAEVPMAGFKKQDGQYQKD